MTGKRALRSAMNALTECLVNNPTHPKTKEYTEAWWVLIRLSKEPDAAKDYEPLKD